MKLFLSEKFTGLHTKSTLISLGLVAETGESFYAEFVDFNKDQVEREHWVKHNVMPNLGITVDGMSGNSDHMRYKGTSVEIIVALNSWIMYLKSKHNITRPIHVWGDCLAFAWVLFNQLIELTTYLTQSISYIPFDICTVFEMKGVNPDVTRYSYVAEEIKEYKSEVLKFIKPNVTHNSLLDAWVIKWCYDKLVKQE